jgi:acetyl-CoA acetyltransferase
VERGDDAADGLSADLRRGRRHSLLAGIRPAPWYRRLRADQGAGDMREVVGFGMAKAAANKVYEAAGVATDDVDVVELHDCFAQNELISYEALGLCAEGDAEKFVCDGDNTYGGKVVTNPSGGLLSKGHPLGATGLAQCTELVQQLRGAAGRRQVDGARLALQHNLGLGGACVVTLYEKA